MGKVSIHLTKSKLHKFISGSGISIADAERRASKGRVKIDVKVPNHMSLLKGKVKLHIDDVSNGSGIKSWFHKTFSKKNMNHIGNEIKNTAIKAGSEFRKAVPKSVVQGAVSGLATGAAAELGPLAPIAGAAAGAAATKLIGYGIESHGLHDRRKFAGEVPHSSKIPVSRSYTNPKRVSRGSGFKPYGSGFRAYGAGFLPL